VSALHAEGMEGGRGKARACRQGGVESAAHGGGTGGKRKRGLWGEGDAGGRRADGTLTERERETEKKRKREKDADLRTDLDAESRGGGGRESVTAGGDEVRCSYCHKVFRTVQARCGHMQGCQLRRAMKGVMRHDQERSVSLCAKSPTNKRQERRGARLERRKSTRLKLLNCSKMKLRSKVPMVKCSTCGALRLKHLGCARCKRASASAVRGGEGKGDRRRSLNMSKAVGARVEVYWDGDDEWFAGTITGVSRYVECVLYRTCCIQVCNTVF
jgi:hypothetical protein